ncbi:MAG: ABC transporter ATP-binding protein [Eubacterium sp.]|nr:ABC transporter ATP-binding protein [Eubacterium sp.]
MDKDIAIKVNNVSKIYNLYDSNKDRALGMLGFRRGVKYREHHALKDVSFEVNKGDCVGIIGTNGAGKSTMLKIITGVLSPTSGSVDIDGRISALLELGAGFNSLYTGIENIYLNGTMIGFSKEEIDSRLDDILEFADIGDFVYQPVKTYSSGMFVRLAFAVAINIDPEILIVDEALSVGDAFFQNKCFKKFEDFKNRGKTILFVSHDLSSIERYCSKAILLDHGINVGEGTPGETINRYKKLMSGMSVKDLKAQEEGTYVPGGASAENASAGSNESEKKWKDSFQINPKLDEYGIMDAKITDFAIMDEQGNLSATLIKGYKFHIKYKVEFFEDVQDPIFTYTFKTLKGQDVTGTNTMYENTGVGLAKKGDVFVIDFEQEMFLQGGDYLLSISCTSFVNGELTVHDRMYDVLLINVVSNKNTVGFYDMNSKVSVEKINS